MAGDWIKMRVWLGRDPNVICMADWLAEQRPFMNWLTDPVQQSCRETAYEHVTRNVTVALCVTGLLVTWGVARERGDRENDDLVLRHCDLETVAAMSDIPLFGEAMAFVEWAEERKDGSVVFPKFFKDNESPDDKHKRQNAERQARHRERQSRESNVTSNDGSNVIVTHREEKRRVVTPIVPALTRFSDFWNVYPNARRVGRGACETKWSKGMLDEHADEIITHVLAMKVTDQWTKDGGKFAPTSQTYLNQQRWRDGAPGTELRRLAV